jgi:hypothetical protein
MADAATNGNGAPRWAWVAKTALGALGTVILVMLVDLRAGQARNGDKADEAIRQGAATRGELAALAANVGEQKAVMEAALAKLRYFRSDDDHDWQTLKERIMRLELQRERAKPVQDGATP